MLKVDRKKHDGFKEEYAGISLDVITHMRPKNAAHREIEPEDGWPSLQESAAHSGNKRGWSRAFKNLYLFYKKTERYGLCEEMGLEKPASLSDEKELRSFMKRFLLADPEKIRKAYKHLKRQSDQSFSKDEFLKYYQQHAYEGMCKMKDRNQVKYNVRIIRSLGITVCPYCGCAIIGRRGSEILGAELDHFINKSKYPFFALCLYNLVPSCGSCNNIKRDYDDEASELISPLEESAEFDSNIKIRFHARPYVRMRGGDLHESRVEVKLITPREDESYARYKANVDIFKLSDTYESFEQEALGYVEKMIRYPKSQIRELEQILAVDLDGIEGWHSRTLYRTQIEKDLFLDQCARADQQAEKLNSKMYMDLYNAYRGK